MARAAFRERRIKIVNLFLFLSTTQMYILCARKRKIQEKIGHFKGNKIALFLEIIPTLKPGIPSLL